VLGDTPIAFASCAFVSLQAWSKVSSRVISNSTIYADSACFPPWPTKLPRGNDPSTSRFMPRLSTRHAILCDSTSKDRVRTLHFFFQNHKKILQNNTIGGGRLCLITRPGGSPCGFDHPFRTVTMPPPLCFSRLSIDNA
jgi:hypothetical protein